MSSETRGLYDEPAQYDAGLTLGGTLEEANEACDAVARDMGMVRVRGEQGCISFREPLLGVRSRFMVSLSVALSDDGGTIHGYVVSSSKGGRTPGQYECVKSVVSVFVARIADEYPTLPKTARATRERQRRRLALRSLRATGWVPALTLIPVVLLAAKYLHRPWSILLIAAWLWLAVTVPATCELLRKRIIGTQSRADFTLPVALTAVMIPFVLLVVVLTIVRP